MPNLVIDLAKFTGRFCLHVLCATIVPVIVPMTVGVILFSTAFLSKPMGSPGTQSGLDILTIFVLPILLAIALGFGVYKRFRDQVALWVPILPLVFFFYQILTWRVYSGNTYWQDIWANFFKSSECGCNFFVTAPCLASMAYAFGAFVGMRRTPRARARLTAD